MHQKKVLFGILGLIVVGAIYYFMPLLIQINKRLEYAIAFKQQLNRELAQIRANGFTLSSVETDKEEEHFVIRLDEPQKASAYLTHRGIRVSTEEAQELKGLKLAVDLAYLNDTLTLDLHPVSLPDKLHAILTQEEDKQLLKQFEKMLRKKTFFSHIDVDPNNSTFQGSIKDINETLKGRQEVQCILTGFHFSGDIKEGKIVTLTQRLQTLYLYMEGMLERTISGLQHDYALTGPTVYDYQEAYTIAKVKFNEAPEAKLVADGIFISTTSSVKNGLASETLNTKIKTIDLMLENMPLGLTDFVLKMHISNIDVPMLDAFQKNDATAGKMLSDPIHIDIPMLSVGKIRDEGKEIDGFSLHSQIDLANSFDISHLATEPTHTLSNMDARIELSLSNTLLAKLKEKPEMLFFYMMYRPKIVADQNIYHIHLKNGSMHINGKVLKINGDPVRF